MAMIFEPLTVTSNKGAFGAVVSVGAEVMQAVQVASGITLERILDYTISNYEFKAVRFVETLGTVRLGVVAPWIVFVEWLDGATVRAGYLTFCRYLGNNRGRANGLDSLAQCSDYWRMLAKIGALASGAVVMMDRPVKNYAVIAPYKKAYKKFVFASNSLTYALKVEAAAMLKYADTNYSIWQAQSADATAWRVQAQADKAAALAVYISLGGTP